MTPQLSVCLHVQWLALKNCFHTMRKWLQWKLFIFRVTVKSLCYTELMSSSFAFEVFLEPIVWVVDHFTHILGPVLVAGVVVLTASVVYIVYWLGLPFYRDYRPYMYAVLMPYGHWLLLNVVFHFYMACRTEPGSVQKECLIPEAVTVCKKCVAPKPPRTHHCSVCNRCVLKMDHHCPWINSCVGHYNHRYFFQYMVSMLLGCLFILMFGAEIAYIEVWLGGNGGPALRDSFYKWWGLNTEPDYPVTGQPISPMDNSTLRLAEAKHPSDAVEEEHRRHSYWIRFALTYAGLLTVGCFLSLGALAVWHARLISRGETSVEQHINKKERKRLAQLGQVYKNPYHFGKWMNWQVFLGIQPGSGRNFCQHVLFPSRHPPLGTGMTWVTCYHSSRALCPGHFNLACRTEGIVMADLLHTSNSISSRRIGSPRSSEAGRKAPSCSPVEDSSSTPGFVLASSKLVDAGLNIPSSECVVAPSTFEYCKISSSVALPQASQLSHSPSNEISSSQSNSCSINTLDMKNRKTYSGSSHSHSGNVKVENSEHYKVA